MIYLLNNMDGFSTVCINKFQFKLETKHLEIICLADCRY